MRLPTATRPLICKVTSICMSDHGGKIPCMEPQEIAAIATSAGVIVALIGAAVSNVVAVRGQRMQERTARDAEAHNRATAERSEAAARLQIDQTARVVEALETLASNIVSGQAVPGPPASVRWQLRYHSGDTYALENVGDATAYAVAVTGHDSLIGPDHLQGGPVLQPGEALTFMAALVLATSDSTISVRWRDSDDEAGTEKAWRYPLPDRPPR